MRFICSLVIGLLFAIQVMSGDVFDSESENTNYEKAASELARKGIHSGMHAEKMLELCIPATKRAMGSFMEYEFVGMPGYSGLTIIAKNSVLARAVYWECVRSRVYFDELTPADEKLYQKLREENPTIEPERMIGRWSWERKRKR